MTGESRTPILIGESGARVFRVQLPGGSRLIEKHGPAPEIAVEAAVLNWCAARLPVPQVIQHSEGVLVMTELPGANLAEASPEDAVNATADALTRIHALPFADCPFSAHWSIRLRQAEERLQAGFVDETDFDEENFGRDPAVTLRELKTFPPLPDLVCFTHGDACLQNFLAHHGRLTGIVDWGRAGVTHPAQDWALALRSMRTEFGPEAEARLRERMPAYCADENLLRRFRLLDEFF